MPEQLDIFAHSREVMLRKDLLQALRQRDAAASRRVCNALADEFPGEPCIEAVHTIESWRRKPAPLGWALQAPWRLDNDDACWPLLAELAWLPPRRLAMLMATASPLVKRLHQAFDARFDAQLDGQGAPDDLARLLCEPPAMAPHLARAHRGTDGPAERAMGLLVELLGPERQGRQADTVRHRRALRDLSAPLFAAYLARR